MIRTAVSRHATSRAIRYKCIIFLLLPIIPGSGSTRAMVRLFVDAGGTSESRRFIWAPAHALLDDLVRTGEEFAAAGTGPAAS
jgi:hypothetical protein